MTLAPSYSSNSLTSVLSIRLQCAPLKIIRCSALLRVLLGWRGALLKVFENIDFSLPSSSLKCQREDNLKAITYFREITLFTS
jgi:hypothetical protein